MYFFSQNTCITGMSVLSMIITESLFPGCRRCWDPVHCWLYALMPGRTAVNFGMNQFEMERFGVLLVGSMLKFLSCVRRCFLPDCSRLYWQYCVAGLMQCVFKLCRVKCGQYIRCLKKKMSSEVM